MIGLCHFSAREESVIADLMYGYTSADIAQKLGIARQSVDVMFKRAVSKIVEANGQNWHDTYAVTESSSRGEKT